MAVSYGSYAAGIGVTKLDEFCSYVGIVSPTKNNVDKSRQKIKASIKKTSGDTLSCNRREHVLAARSSDNYPGDVTATIQGKKVKVARGAAATDGAGNTRAYNHLIRGSQHSLVVISLITQKPLVVISHQISCWRCSNAMTKLMKEKNKRMCALDISDVKLDRKCCRNTILYLLIWYCQNLSSWRTHNIFSTVLNIVRFILYHLFSY